MTTEHIKENIDILFSNLEELRKQVNKIPSRLETIKAFLVQEVIRRDISLEAGKLLIAELNKCEKNIPGWLIDEIYRPKPPVVTLGKPK